MLREQVTVHVPPAALLDRATCLLLRRVEGPASESLHAAVHANPYACLNVVASGRASSGGRALPRAFLCGPFSAPLAAEAHGGLVSASLVFPPWMLGPVFSCAAGELVDRLRELESANPHLLESLLAACANSRGDTPGLERLWSFWDALTRGLVPPALALATLAQHGVGAASAELGCTARHYRRKFRLSMGLAPVEWCRVMRWEKALGGLTGGAMEPLGEVAVAAGYADQAHLTRETRALAGKPPARLRHAILAADGHWSLAPARVRSVQDAATR